MFTKIFILACVPMWIGNSLCDDCQYEISDGAVYSIAYEAVVRSRDAGLESPYSYWHRNWISDFLSNCDSYSIYREQFQILTQWASFSFSDSAATCSRSIAGLELTIAEIRSRKPVDHESIRNHQDSIDSAQKYLISKTQNASLVNGILHQALADISEKCRRIYSFCIKKHKDQDSFYQRSLIYYDQGKLTECVEDISRFLATGQSIPELINAELSDGNAASNLFLIQGIGYSDLGQYNQAIEALSEAIRLNPDNREALLERAAAYFEIGDFELSIADFFSSGYHTTPIEPSMLDYATGFISGAYSGGIEGAKEFFPALLGSIHGLGSAIWSLATTPQQFSAEVLNCCLSCVEFLNTHSTPEIVGAISPDLRDLVFDSTSLSNHRKGEILGSFIGKHGIEMFGNAVLLKIFRDLRKANMIMTLETLASEEAGVKLLEEVAKYKAKHFGITRNTKSAEEIVAPFRGINLPESTIRKVLYELDITTFPRPKGLPANFKADFSKKNCGMSYHDPKNPRHNFVRVMPGDPTSPNPCQQKPYVVHARDGKAVGKHGKLVEREAI